MATRGATSGLTPGIAAANSAGRFWALAEAGTGDSDDDDGDSDGGPEGTSSPTPSDAICKPCGWDILRKRWLCWWTWRFRPTIRRGVACGQRTRSKSLDAWFIDGRRLYRRGRGPKVIFRTTALIRMWSLLTRWRPGSVWLLGLPDERWQHGIFSIGLDDGHLIG
ncbi:uncharacterized protein LOC119271476 [Triticum dicoccoides]|uniref:uncharacterized protein LOC119271476 n=1 Tax=Triticum dicoccoides TaxID=85692 RepID=UPI00188F45DC|nr:uncharacterized protein LOC119271476 [Triticum dicoccoides]XP_044336965.1 uncharacterized protein LOC123058236 [Triticum aestivum]